MPHFNEELIRSVFDEMIKYNPSLVKHTIPDEDDEEVDFRNLGDQVIKNFPWPIGVELRRLFSGIMWQLDRMRLDQIFKTIERSMQFLSFVMVAQLWVDKKDGNVKVPESFSKDFESRFSVLSLGNFTWLIRSIGTIYAEQGATWFLEEIGTNFDKKFYAALDFWVPERNEIGHYQINLSQEEIEKRCVEYEDKLKFILFRLAFLAKYRLVSVRDIRVNKPKFEDARFLHKIELLNSSDSDFTARELNESKYAESNSVLMMRSIKSLGEYLNLSPLIIDTKGEVLDAKEKFMIKKDIFMYTKYRNDHLMYLGTEVTEKCDLRSLSNYETMVSEFRKLLETISSK
ncbi:hypothetical protein ACFLT1_08020 [Bacteroidota bacterium]